MMLRSVFRLLICCLAVSVIALLSTPTARAGSVVFDDQLGFLQNVHDTIQKAAASAPFNVEILVRENVELSQRAMLVKTHAQQAGANTVIFLYNKSPGTIIMYTINSKVSDKEYDAIFTKVGRLGTEFDSPPAVAHYFEMLMVEVAKITNPPSDNSNFIFNAISRGRPDSHITLFGFDLSARWLLLIFPGIVVAVVQAYRRKRPLTPRTILENNTQREISQKTYSDDKPPTPPNSVDSPFVTDVTTAGFVNRATRDGLPMGYSASVRPTVTHPTTPPAQSTTTRAQDDEEWGWFDDLIKNNH